MNMDFRSGLLPGQQQLSRRRRLLVPEKESRHKVYLSRAFIETGDGIQTNKSRRDRDESCVRGPSE